MALFLGILFLQNTETAREHWEKKTETAKPQKCHCWQKTRMLNPWDSTTHGFWKTNLNLYLSISSVRYDVLHIYCTCGFRGGTNVSFFPHCTFSQYFAMILALVLVCTSTADCLCWLTANLNALIPFCSICFLRSLSAFSCWAYLAFLHASKHFCCISVCQKDTALCNRDEKTFFIVFSFLLWFNLGWNYFKASHENS